MIHWIYILERKDKLGFTERIQSFCAKLPKWRTVAKLAVEYLPDGQQKQYKIIEL